MAKDLALGLNTRPTILEWSFTMPLKQQFNAQELEFIGGDVMNVRFCPSLADSCSHNLIKQTWIFLVHH